ncbi:prenyltransferase/squalene oxidase repeat-containing protein [Streptomyces sp. NPDC002845]
MNVRRSTAVPAGMAALAAVAVITAIGAIGVGSAPAARAATSAGADTSAATSAWAEDASPSPSQAIPTGLYGSTDPTYDGVWRQSLTLLALDTAGVKPAAEAVDWLVGQQCASGAFAAYRADATAKCDAKTPVDTNSTAAAVQALAALGGHDGEVGQAARWLKDVQNKNGGWGYTPGDPSDANSTSVVIGAFVASGDEPEEQRKGDYSPYETLRAFSVPCGDDGGGAFAYQPDKNGTLTANADATAAAVLGSLGKGFVAEAGEARTAAECVGGDAFSSEDAAHNGAVYLAKALAEDGHLKDPGDKEQPDYGNTVDAVVALAAAGQEGSTDKPLAWLEKNAGPWAAQSGPAAYAQLILAAHATGTDPRDFGGADLVEQLDATGPASDVSDHSAVPTEPQAGEDEDSGVSVWWVIGVGLVGGIGVGFLISGRNKKRQP